MLSLDLGVPLLDYAATGVRVERFSAIWCRKRCREKQMHHAENLSMQSSSGTGNGRPMFYRMREVLRMTALSRSTLYRRIADGTFPAPVSLGGSAKGGRRSDLKEWEQDPAGFKLMESCTTMTTSQGAKVRQVRY